MPGILLFGRKLRYSSDDLIVPAFYSICTQIPFLAATISLANTIPDECGPSFNWIFQYCVFNGTLLALMILNEFIVGYFSLKGTIADETPRRPVRAFLYVWILLNVTDLVLQTVSVTFYITGAAKCDEPFNTYNRWLFIGIILFLLVAVYNVATFLFYMMTSKPAVSQTPAHEGRHGFWIGFLSPFFAIFRVIPFTSRVKPITNENNGNLVWLADSIAHLFGDDDLTTTDLLAGLALLNRRQRWEAQHKTNKTNSTCSSSSSVESNSETLRYEGKSMLDSLERRYNPKPIDADERLYDIVTFFKYTDASYGRPVAIFDNFWYGVLKLFIPCLDRKSDSPTDVAKRSVDRAWTSCAFCWSPAILQSRGGSHPDLVYLSRKCGLFTSPYFIALDHKEKAVVLTIRGSLSVADIVTDIHWVPAPIKFKRPDGKEDIFYTHGGIWESTQTIYQDLEKRGFLDDLLLKPDSPYKDYRLVLVGHSLGSGISPLLAHLFIQSNRYPQKIHAVCYASPGCMTCENGREYLQQFCTTWILGDDIIPRSSPRSYQRMIKRFRHEVKTCHNKRKVDLLNEHTVMKLFSKKDTKMHPPVIHEDPEKNKIEFSVNEEFKMYCPGYVVHFERRGKKTNPKKGCRKYLKREFVAVWKDDSEFNEVLITKNTILDHLPNRQFHVINDWAEYSPVWKEILEKRETTKPNYAGMPPASDSQSPSEAEDYGTCSVSSEGTLQDDPRLEENDEDVISEDSQKDVEVVSNSIRDSAQSAHNFDFDLYK